MGNKGTKSSSIDSNYGMGLTPGNVLNKLAFLKSFYLRAANTWMDGARKSQHVLLNQIPAVRAHECRKGKSIQLMIRNDEQSCLTLKGI